MQNVLGRGGTILTPLLLLALTLLAVALFLFWIEPPILLPLLERLTPNLTYRIRTSHPLVALSFDDGPHPIFTPQVLEILHQHNAHATFFLIGERAPATPTWSPASNPPDTKSPIITSQTVRFCSTPKPTSSATWNKPKKPSA